MTTSSKPYIDLGSPGTVFYLTNGENFRSALGALRAKSQGTNESVTSKRFRLFGRAPSGMDRSIARTYKNYVRPGEASGGGSRVDSDHVDHAVLGLRCLSELNKRKAQFLLAGSDIEFCKSEKGQDDMGSVTKDPEAATETLRMPLSVIGLRQIGDNHYLLDLIHHHCGGRSLTRVTWEANGGQSPSFEPEQGSVEYRGRRTAFDDEILSEAASIIRTLPQDALNFLWQELRRETQTGNDSSTRTAKVERGKWTQSCKVPSCTVLWKEDMPEPGSFDLTPAAPEHGSTATSSMPWYEYDIWNPVE